jgi:hypothetical protein
VAPLAGARRAPNARAPPALSVLLALRSVPAARRVASRPLAASLERWASRRAPAIPPREAAAAPMQARCRSLAPSCRSRLRAACARIPCHGICLRHSRPNASKAVMRPALPPHMPRQGHAPPRRTALGSCLARFMLGRKARAVPAKNKLSGTKPALEVAPRSNRVRFCRLLHRPQIPLFNRPSGMPDRSHGTRRKSRFCRLFHPLL